MSRRAEHQMTDMPTKRVVLVNSYRMKEAKRLIDLGVYPAQHLWGLWNLSSAWRTSVTDLCLNHLAEKSKVAGWFVRNTERVLGDPLQSIWALTGQNAGSIVYAANPKTGTMIGFLKRLRLLQVPYVVLVHSYPISNWARWCLEGADSILVFSGAIKDRMTADGFSDSLITVANWGPDLDWPEYRQSAGDAATDFISAGKTNRDYESIRTLGADGSLDGNVLDGSAVVTYTNGVVRRTAGRPGYPEVMRLMASASVVYIPLRDPSMLSGLTELSDAVALGKPLVMTKNDWMPIDIEDLGIGIWLEDHSPDAVRAAIERASRIPRERIMDVAEWFNMKDFSETLEGVLDELWTKYRSGNGFD